MFYLHYLNQEKINAETSELSKLKKKKFPKESYNFVLNRLKKWIERSKLQKAKVCGLIIQAIILIKQ